MSDWLEVHIINVVGYGLLSILGDFADHLESIITILGIAALGWYNVERALRVRRERYNKSD